MNGGIAQFSVGGGGGVAQVNLADVHVKKSLMLSVSPDRSSNIGDGCFGDQDKITVGVIPSPENEDDEELEYNKVWLANIGNNDDR